ncbi:MAG: hypothetical protein CMO80_02955 [Verrucomicrobiales bacterium]|nr:hypothetical protein [Verrucomicrobiales bacterium]|tara:strand:- start:1932 stop:3155 length:1224 start_codon:yes stop_codon:yes gene_type:complete
MTAMTESSSQPEPEHSPARKKGKPSLPLIIVMSVILVMVLFKQDSIRAEAELRGLIDSEAPNPELLARLVKQSDEPSKILLRVWRSGKIPHRWEVLDYINRQLIGNKQLLDDAEDIIAEAPLDRDITTRLLGLNLMRLVEHPGWVTYSRYQLEDPDPEMRKHGLDMLGRGSASNSLADVVERFNDIEPEVREKARKVFELLTGIGPRPEDAPAGYPSDPARSWWGTNYLNYPKADLPKPSRLTHAIDLGKVQLLDTNGAPLSVSSFSGKPALLGLFASWSFQSTLALRELSKVQASMSNSLIVRAVCVDAVPGVKHDHTPGADTNNSPVLTDAEFAGLQKKIAGLVKQNRLQYPYLFDRGGELTRKVEGSELPTFIIIGRDSKLIRRFAGGRSASAFTNIIQTIVTD